MYTLRIEAVLMLVALTRCALPAQTYTVLKAFDGADGAYPQSSLVQGADGYLYGTTYAGGRTFGGGSNGAGTVFKISPSGNLITLYNFCSQAGCTDGANPRAGLVLATNGDFYGTTIAGGTNCAPYGCGTIFRIRPNGKLTTLYSFCSQTGCPDGENPNGLMQGADGDFYGTTTLGGMNLCPPFGGCGTVFRLHPDGGLTTLVSLDGANGGLPYGTLVQAGNGELYGTTEIGGANCAPYGCGTIFRIGPGGGLTTLYNFCSLSACADGNGPASGLIQASSGDFYGVTSSGGSHGYGTAFRFTKDHALITLYNFCSQDGCTDGYDPAGLIQADGGREFYGMTSYGGANNNASCGNGFGATGCGTIFRLSSDGVFTTVYDFCAESDCTDGSNPVGNLVQDTNGDFYGTTDRGGSANLGVVFSLSTGAAAVTFGGH